MLLKIREKSRGVFSWLIILAITIPFALWGIQDYLGVGQEKPIATVGKRDFFQTDINRAYVQFKQNTQENIAEQTLKKQALEKLILDEVLWQHAQREKLVINNASTRKYIASLDYFKTDGKFDKKKYDTLLATQKMTSIDFTSRIEKALIMGQFQRSITDSGFATDYDVANFFKIQNQQRNIEMLTIPLTKPTKLPTEEEIKDYYQQNQDKFKTTEQVSIEYIAVSLNKIALEQTPNEQQLLAFYTEQKDMFTTSERRRISHILFTHSATALSEVKNAKQRSNNEDFSILAKELSADKFSAENGGDLGLIAIGDMQKEFEEAVFSLQEGDISQPVKTEFGYHLIKVTELSKRSVQEFATVKDKVKMAYQKNQAENIFFEKGEILAEVSYESPDNLNVAAEAVGIKPKISKLFTRLGGIGIAAEPKVIEAAFAEDTIAGNNSKLIELEDGKVVVLRIHQHHPAELKPLNKVKSLVRQELIILSAKMQTIAQAKQIKKDAQSGISLKELAERENLVYKNIANVTRNNSDLKWQVKQAIFSAAKPEGNYPTSVRVSLTDGNQAIINILSVTSGNLPTLNKRKSTKTNIGKMLGWSDFNTVLNSLQKSASIVVNEEK